MCAFVTGASGWIGSHGVPELIRAGHQASGLADEGVPLRDLAEGCVGGEFLAVHTEDVDLEKREILVRRSLTYDKKSASRLEFFKRVLGPVIARR
jgi:nucleoside-diphosphate-sugar epimerase